MNHKYNVGDIIFDHRFDEYHLIVGIGIDDLFGLPSYLLARIYGHGKTIQFYSNIRSVDRSNEFMLVA